MNKGTTIIKCGEEKIGNFLSETSKNQISQYFDPSILESEFAYYEAKIDGEFNRDWMGDPSVPNGTYDCSYWEVTKAVVTLDEEMDDDFKEIIQKEVINEKIDEVIKLISTLIKQDLEDYLLESNDLDEDFNDKAYEEYLDYIEGPEDYYDEY